MSRGPRRRTEAENVFEVLKLERQGFLEAFGIACDACPTLTAEQRGKLKTTLHRVLCQGEARTVYSAVSTIVPRRTPGTRANTGGLPERRRANACAA